MSINSLLKDAITRSFSVLPSLIPDSLSTPRFILRSERGMSPSSTEGFWISNIAACIRKWLFLMLGGSRTVFVMPRVSMTSPRPSLDTSFLLRVYRALGSLSGPHSVASLSVFPPPLKHLTNKMERADKERETSRREKKKRNVAEVYVVTHIAYCMLKYVCEYLYRITCNPFFQCSLDFFRKCSLMMTHDVECFSNKYCLYLRLVVWRKCEWGSVAAVVAAPPLWHVRIYVMSCTLQFCASFRILHLYPEIWVATLCSVFGCRDFAEQIRRAVILLCPFVRIAKQWLSYWIICLLTDKKNKALCVAFSLFMSEIR